MNIFHKVHFTWTDVTTFSRETTRTVATKAIKARADSASNHSANRVRVRDACTTTRTDPLTGVKVATKITKTLTRATTTTRGGKATKIKATTRAAATPSTPTQRRRSMERANPPWRQAPARQTTSSSRASP